MEKDNGRIAEKRKYIRLPIEAHVSYRMVGAKDSTLEKATCANISPEGMCLILNKPVKNGARLHIEIAINDRKPFSVTGEVVWVKEGAEVVAGIKILDIKDEDKNRFLLELCDKMADALSRKYPKIKF